MPEPKSDREKLIVAVLRLDARMTADEAESLSNLSLAIQVLEAMGFDPKAPPIAGRTDGYVVPRAVFESARVWREDDKIDSTARAARAKAWREKAYDGIPPHPYKITTRKPRP